MVERGRRESDRVRMSRCARFLRGCARCWTGGAVEGRREENVSKLWSDRGRGESEKLDREQRRVKTRSRVCPSMWVAVEDHCERPKEEVLEEVCKKQNFNPREYNLKFQRTVLNLSLQWRFANLPNNAKLEMVSRCQQPAAAENAKVRVALQLEEGARLQDEFLCSQSLWEVLSHFSETRACLEAVAPGSVAVCIYMRDEVSGEQSLKQTTLQSLGLTSGSAIVRFVVRKSEPPVNRQPAILQEKIKKKPYVQKTEMESPPLPEKPAESKKDQQSIDSTKLHEPNAALVKSVNATNSSTVTDVQPDLEGDKPGPSSIGLSEASTQPQVTSFRPFQGGGHRLGGANVPTEDNMLTATAQEPIHSPGPSKPKKSKTDGEESFSGPIDRETLVCHLDLEESGSASSQELPDDFFEITVDDVRRRFAELRSERKRLEEAPLRTKALRDAQLQEKLERYPKVVLRVLFPDRYILQGFFRVSETIGAVREFVSTHLEEADIPFYLFITPPRTELKDDSITLFQAQLFPAAVVHFGSPEQREHFLRQEFVNEPMSPSQADILVARAMPRVAAVSAAPVVEEHPEAGAVAAQRAPENYEEQSGISDSHQQVQKDQGKVPKWLKLPGKK